MALKDNLKQRRKQLGLTLEEVAKKIGITRQTVQKYESGVVTNIPLDRIELLAKALDTTPAYLMGWEDDAPTNNQQNTRGNYPAYDYDDVTNQHAEMFSKLTTSGKEKVIDYTKLVYNSENTAE